MCNLTFGYIIIRGSLNLLIFGKNTTMRVSRTFPLVQVEVPPLFFKMPYLR